MILQKVCMLGTSAVGKSSLVARFVRDIFQDRYVTTIGVNIEQKVVETDDHTVNMQLWDLPGDDPYQRLEANVRYLKGSHGFILVADGTRPDTLSHLVALTARLEELDIDEGAFDNVKRILLINKADLVDEWAVDASMYAPLKQVTVVQTSAKTGEGVEEAFRSLAELLVAAF